MLSLAAFSFPTLLDLPIGQVCLAMALLSLLGWFRLNTAIISHCEEVKYEINLLNSVLHCAYTTWQIYLSLLTVNIRVQVRLHPPFLIKWRKFSADDLRRIPNMYIRLTSFSIYHLQSAAAHFCGYKSAKHFWFSYLYNNGCSRNCHSSVLRSIVQSGGMESEHDVLGTVLRIFLMDQKT